MKLETINRLRAAWKRLSVPVRATPIMVPPSLYADVEREHPELVHLIGTIPRMDSEIAEVLATVPRGTVALRVYREGDEIKYDAVSYDEFYRTPPRWPEDWPVDTPRRLPAR